MGRKKRWEEQLRVPLAQGTIARVDAVLSPGEPRLNLIRGAIDAELGRREAGVPGPAQAAGQAPRTRVQSARFTIADVRRAVKAAESAGKIVTGMHFPPEGGFTVLFEPSSALPATENEWDEVLHENPRAAMERVMVMASARSAKAKDEEARRRRDREIIPL